MSPSTEKTSILDIPLKRWFPANLETLLIVLLLLAAFVSRLYGLGDRTVSHDEVNHVTPAYSLYTGNGYLYDPLSHGPLQFHMMAFSYALFGDNDFTTRIPAAVFSITAIILAVFAFRRFLGRAGAFIAGLLFLISPLNLFYGRYERNEAFIVVWGLLILYSILRYLEHGETWVLFLFTLANAFHFTDKATSYMFAAEEFIFLAAYFLHRLSRRDWPLPQPRRTFFFALLLSVILFFGATGLYLTHKPLTSLLMKIPIAVLAVAGVGALVWAGVELVKAFGWADLRTDRPLRLIMLLGTFILPLMGALPIQLLGFTPLDYTSQGLLRIAIAAGLLGAIAVAVGLAWFGRKWLYFAAVFFTPFVILYSTFFTSPNGIAGGLVGALSYWTVQQGVARGGQPLYYYAFLLIPVYEFLPALGTIVAAGIATRKKLWQSQAGRPFTSARVMAGLEMLPDAETTTNKEILTDVEPGPTSTVQVQVLEPAPGPTPVPIAALFVYWSISSLAVFTYAGEKMPWLTIHIALPMILSAAWAIGWMVETVPWGSLARWTLRNFARGVALAGFLLLGLLTARAAYRAAFINYDYPLEYLVYAHAAPDPKVLYNEIQELSYRITGTTDLVVAYDNDVRYPYWWYLRRYPNRLDFDVNPTTAERNAVVIGVSDGTLSKIMPVVKDNYYEYNGMRLWWPNMDYWSLKWEDIASERNLDFSSKNPDKPVPPMTVFEYVKYAWPHIRPFFTDAKTRYAVWQIWFNRDYTAWGILKNNPAVYTLKDWGVSNRLHYFIRKDITNLLWPLGAPLAPPIQNTDPYEGITSPAKPDQTLGSGGSEPGQFASPRQIALAGDGSLYVANSLNHRIQHLSPEGKVLQVWGSFADISVGAAPGGTFNEPWGVAVGPDGSVYVSDTWNYRIQKFTSTGKFVTMWGSGPAIGPDGLYGPRGITVDGQGRVFVADTGNKRIVIYDGEGKYLGEFGSGGVQLGQLDEPVDVAIDRNGKVYVTDTWNQRVQVFTPDASGLVYTAEAEWPVEGWYGNSLENKPFITVDEQANVLVTDPELCRVIEFKGGSGQPERVWDGCGAGGFALPSGLVSDGVGGVWVSDARNGTLVHFKAQLP